MDQQRYQLFMGGNGASVLRYPRLVQEIRFASTIPDSPKIHSISVFDPDTGVYRSLSASEMVALFRDVADASLYRL